MVRIQPAEPASESPIYWAFLVWYNKTMLSDATPFIRKVSEGQNLTAAETERALDIVIKEDTEGWFIWSLLLTLHTKGETGDELLGFCRNYVKRLPKLNPRIDADEITDTSGTGGDRVKTFNISTTASVVLAGAGVTVAKQAFFAVTGLTGSAEVFGAFGVDIMKIRTKQIEKTLETIGICPYLKEVMGRTVGLENLMVTQRMSEKGLKLVSPLHLVANIATPIKMKRRVYGCTWEKHLLVLAELLRKLGYTRGMVVHGLDGIDEVSNIGKTKIVEFTAKKTKTYTIKPADLGIKRAKFEDIKAVSKERNIIDFLRIIYGKDKSPRRDIVLANTAASLYVMDKVKDLAEGVEMAGKVIDEGLAFKKFEQLVKTLGNEKQLSNWEKKAGLASNYF